MPSTITITCQGGCGRRLVMDAVGHDNWHVSDTCKECQDRQMADYYRAVPGDAPHWDAPEEAEKVTR